MQSFSCPSNAFRLPPALAIVSYHTSWTINLKTMSSAIQSALTSLQQNNYVSLAILTALGHDYVLTFSNEIEYIWVSRHLAFVKLHFGNQQRTKP
ncbi:hypothetical protein OG21DRAFT_1175995 [Imleria badia]|nr:hypothetical protein OG21DRAFT_1175995 [Imleria badia]